MSNDPNVTVQPVAQVVGASNLHRWLAPVSDAAWAEIAEEASRTFRRNVAGRRVVDVTGPLGLETAAANTGHVSAIDAPHEGTRSRLREVAPLVELRVPFTLDRQAVDDVLRGSRTARSSRGTRLRGSAAWGRGPTTRRCRCRRTRASCPTPSRTR
jgi:hypothetical protein